ncbi:hypothetical protein ABEB36_015381 [Hypothenemus hampei]|uniref:Anillin homology domain-containing protein n=1 Tax=Hypothenemus hampei TaxID=57062 RepID=A0ABD1E004_HYPHA
MSLDKPETTSINTADISALISKSTTKNCSLSIHNSKSSTIHVESCNSSDLPTYEEVLYLENTPNQIFLKKQIQDELLVNERVIEKMLKTFKKNQLKNMNFLGSDQHLTIEKVLVLAEIHRAALFEIFEERETNNMEMLSAQVFLSNLKCTLNIQEDLSIRLEDFYMCTFQHKTTIYSSELSSLNKIGNIPIPGTMTFNNMNPNFSINITLYSLSIPKKNKRCTPKTFKLPLIKLIGKTSIRLSNAKDGKFAFEFSNSNKIKNFMLCASVKIYPK